MEVSEGTVGGFSGNAPDSAPVQGAERMLSPPGGDTGGVDALRMWLMTRHSVGAVAPSPAVESVGGMVVKLRAEAKREGNLFH